MLSIVPGTLNLEGMTPPLNFLYPFHTFQSAQAPIVSPRNILTVKMCCDGYRNEWLYLVQAIQSEQRIFQAFGEPLPHQLPIREPDKSSSRHKIVHFLTFSIFLFFSH